VGVLVLGISVFVALGAGHASVTPARMLAIGMVVTLAMVAGVFALRRSLMKNAFNRSLLALLVSAVLGSFVNRALGYALDTPVATTAALEMFLFLGVTVGGAACLARSLWASVALLAAAFVAIRALPEHAIGIFSGASLVNVFVLYLALWREARRVAT
jgi:hypothetical protein